MRVWQGNVRPLATAIFTWTFYSPIGSGGGGSFDVNSVYHQRRWYPVIWERPNWKRKNWWNYFWQVLIGRAEAQERPCWTRIRKVEGPALVASSHALKSKPSKWHSLLSLVSLLFSNQNEKFLSFLLEWHYEMVKNLSAICFPVVCPHNWNLSTNQKSFGIWEI